MNSSTAIAISWGGHDLKTDWQTLRRLALAEIESVLDELPAALRERARAVPITLETVPNAGLQEDGIMPDTLGLFTGPEFAEEEHVPLPPQIILFLENIRDVSEDDVEIFREEVRITLLHELGHYLGLGEDELSGRGLE